MFFFFLFFPGLYLRSTPAEEKINLQHIKILLSSESQRQWESEVEGDREGETERETERESEREKERETGPLSL